MTKLNELDKTEASDLAADCGLSEDEFEAAWAEFVRLKTEHLRQQALN